MTLAPSHPAFCPISPADRQLHSYVTAPRAQWTTCGAPCVVNVKWSLTESGVDDQRNFHSTPVLSFFILLQFFSGKWPWCNRPQPNNCRLLILSSSKSSDVPCLTCCVKYNLKKRRSFLSEGTITTQLTKWLSWSKNTSTFVKITRQQRHFLCSYKESTETEEKIRLSVSAHSQLYIIYIWHHAACTETTQHALRFIHEQWIHYKSALLLMHLFSLF